MTTPLPTTRHILTSLLNTLTNPPPSSTSQTKDRPVNDPYDTPSNPLKALPPSQRALLSTLHVLFQPPMLLPALDLLDRGLVLRIVQGLAPTPTAQPEHRESEVAQDVSPPQASIHLRSPSQHQPLPEVQNPDVESLKRKERNAIYLVRSSQPPKSRFKDATSSNTGGMTYTVRLSAWNCSCAAFAFASFPSSSLPSSKSPWALLDDEDRQMGVDRRVFGGRNRREEGSGDGEEEWEFGGMSLDGREQGSVVPVCKHLLACLLGERWGVLGGYVRERVVSREEMAGLGAEA